MKLFAVNLLLALAWGAVHGSFAAATLAVGAVLGFAALWLASPLFGETAYFARVGRVAGFAGFYVWEMVVSAVRVARDVLSPRLRVRPGVVAVALDARTDLEITLFANLVSLTPGTLSLDVSPDRRTLYVHAMDLPDGDVEAWSRELKRTEARVIGLLR